MSDGLKCHFAFVLTIVCLSARAATDHIVPPAQSVEGQFQAEGSTVWWQWAVSFWQART
jgi:hypothetical protein